MKPPAKDFFRAAAIENYLAAEELGGHIAVSPPWTWGLLSATAVAVLVALTGSILGSVEVTAKSRGILRSVDGNRPLTAQVSGTVEAVLARTGDPVEKGSLVARLESSPLRAQMVVAKGDFRSLESEHTAYSSRQDAMVAEQRRLLVARLGTLEEEAKSQQDSVSLYERKLEINLQLREGGLLSQIGVEESREALAQARRQAVATKRSALQAQQDLAALEMRRQEDLWNRRRALLSAKDRLDGLTMTLRQLEIPATGSGTLEAMLVKPGDAVQAGAVIARLIPHETDLEVVSFLPEKDRAFLNEEDRVMVEFYQLPSNEFGAFEGRITRIGRDLASATEVRESMGEGVEHGAPTYRVEIRLNPRLGNKFGELRTGMLADVRYTLRRQRVITLLLEPLGRWLN